MSTKKHDYSWGLIILLFIVFWPAAVVLLVLKMSEESKLQSGDKSGGSTVSSLFPFIKPAEPPVNKTVTCPGCGAQNNITSKLPHNCEYCGNALK